MAPIQFRLFLSQPSTFGYTSSKRVTLLGAQEQYHRRVIPLVHLVSGVVVHIHLHLPDVLMAEESCFQINQHKTL